MNLLDRVATGRLVVRHFLIVTHTVPAERARPYVPERLDLDTVPGPDGKPRAVIASTCFCNEHLHWTPLPWPHLSFWQSTFRIYVRDRQARPGSDAELAAFFLGTYVDGSLPYAAQRAIARGTRRGHFQVELEQDPDTEAYRRYAAQVEGAFGTLQMEARAADPPPATLPFVTGQALAYFITHRPYGYFALPGGALGLLPVRHPVMRPVSGTLLHGRFDFWESRGILTREEAERPYSVLITSAVPFLSYPPRPVL